MNNNQVTCDPQRIERFLGEQLSDGEQAAFESHLDDCNDCRERLEAAAAGNEVWSGVRDALLCGELPSDGVRTGDSALESAGDETSFECGAVISLLAPTDDDRMIGRLGSYEVSGVIGSGGMGVVLKGFDAALNRYVAIKVLAPHLGGSGAARKRFSREAQAAAAIVHENVIEIHGVADEDGLPYLVMPYVRGPSLQRRLNFEGPLALVEILRIGMQAAAGLAAAHAQGLVHRDVKPANILLGDGVERVKLTDFGLARAADDASLTKTGIIAGTPQYMSPEQARGEPVDQKSDLFSLGSVLYAMCTGRAPFRAETSYGVLHRITDEQPQPIRQINPDVPAWLCGIIARLMSKQPGERFESAREVAELLEECLAHVQQPTVVPEPALIGNTPSSDKRQQPPTQFRRVALAIAGAALFLLAGVVIVLELNKGTLRIELPQAGVADLPIRIMQGDRIHARLTVTPQDNSVRIAAGPYVVEIEGEHDGLQVDGDHVTVTRGGTHLVNIVRTAPDAEDHAMPEDTWEQYAAPDHGIEQVEQPIGPAYVIRNPNTGVPELDPEWETPVRRMLATARAIEVSGGGRRVAQEIPPAVSGAEAQRLIGVVVALVADGTVSRRPESDHVVLITTDAQSARIAESLLPAAINHLMRPGDAEQPDDAVSGNPEDGDPDVLRTHARRLCHIAVENLLSGEAHVFFYNARWFWEMALYLEEEAELRVRSREHAERAAELRAAGRLGEAEAREVESELLAAQADLTAAEFRTEQDRRDVAGRLRDEAGSLATQIDILAKQGLAHEAAELEAELNSRLRERDPDWFRARDLHDRIIDARLRGHHEIADRFVAERRELLESLEERYPGAGDDEEGEETPGTAQY